jgi:hypothetical protein
LADRNPSARQFFLSIPDEVEPAVFDPDAVGIPLPRLTLLAVIKSSGARLSDKQTELVLATLA